MKNIELYSQAEEKINIFTHALGFLLSIGVFIPLILRVINFGELWITISFSIFGFSLIFLYGSSTLYHSAKNIELRYKLKIIDHSSIYVLIAGTYTPFCLVTLNGSTGWIIFCISWGLAIIGIILKLFFTGRFKVISTIAYVLMGWLIVFAISPLINNLSSEGLFWLFAGGLSYTTGAILYSIKKIKFNHAIFHVFVLAGSFSHFISVYYYVLPE
ncbi:MAG: hemolysin III family protein [Bacteroidetes bacterium]|nr:hemolysin III family protein [Bacteroidota bacterium]